MSTFDINAYLQNRAQAVPVRNEITPVQQPEIVPVAQAPSTGGDITSNNSLLKAMALSRATEEKRIELVQRKQALANAEIEANKDSVVSQLGLDPESFLGEVVNTAVATAAVVPRGVANVLAMPAGMNASINESQISPENMQVLMAMDKGYKPTEQEQARLNARIAGSNESSADAYFGPRGIKQMREASAALRTGGDYSKYVNTTVNRKFQEELVSNPEYLESAQRLQAAGWDVTKWQPSDVATLVSNGLKTAGNNPAAVIQSAFEQIPGIVAYAVNPAAAATSAVAYAQEHYDKWAESQTTPPTSGERQTALAKAYSLAAVEMASDVVTGGLLKLSKAATKALPTATPAVTAQTFKERLLGIAATTTAPLQKPATVVAKTAGAMASEAPVEAYQTYIEQDLAGRPATFDQLYTAGVTGALTSGGIVGTVALAPTSLPTAKPKADDTEAIKAGNIAPFLQDTDATKRQWVKAADILVKNSNLEESTTDKVESNLKQFDTDILTPLRQQVQQAMLQTTEGREEIASQLIATANAQKQVTTDPTELVALDQKIENFKKLGATAVDPKPEKGAAKALKVLKSQLVGVTGLYKGLEAVAASKRTEASLETDTQAVLTSTEPSNEQAVSGLLVRAMKAKGDLSDSLAQSLVALADSGKATAEQASTLRMLADDIVASNKLKTATTVQQDVLTGAGAVGAKPEPGKDFIGIKTRRDGFKAAMEADNTDMANTQYKGLKAFVASQADKLEKLKSLKLGEALLSIKDSSGKHSSWVVKPIKSITKEELNGRNHRQFVKSNGGFIWDVGQTNKGLTELVNNLEESVNIGTPILKKMGYLLGNTKEVDTNVGQTSETKQTSEARKESTSKVGTVTPTEPTKQREAPTKQEDTTLIDNLTTKVTGFMEYFDTPPEDATEDRGNAIKSWAEKQLVRVVDRLRTTAQDSPKTLAALVKTKKALSKLISLAQTNPIKEVVEAKEPAPTIESVVEELLPEMVAEFTPTLPTIKQLEAMKQKLEIYKQLAACLSK